MSAQILSGEDSPFYQRAVDIAESSKSVSISQLQKCLGTGFNRSANLIEEMEANGIVGQMNAQGVADLIITDKVTL